MLKEEKQMHIACGPGDVGSYCILPGDPGRCGQIAAYFDDASKVAQNREFTVYTGALGGEKVSVCSTGIGGPSAAIAMEELVHLGAHTFIRVGTCGGIRTDVLGGDLVVAVSAVRQEGTSREYMPVEYPATADFDVVCALREACVSLGLRHHVGVVQSKDSFYGQHRPDAMPVGDELIQRWKAWKQAGVLASEMETAALFVVAAVRGVRCGAVYNVLWNQEREAQGLDNPIDRTTEKGVRAAVEAMKLLIASGNGEK